MALVEKQGILFRPILTDKCSKTLECVWVVKKNLNIFFIFIFWSFKLLSGLPNSQWQEERERLLKQVKEDNQEIAAMEKQTKELNDKISSLQDEIQQLEMDIDENQGE